jgi:hypothetical protein
MGIVIIAVAVILYVVLVGAIWHNLDAIENSKRVGLILISILFMAIITLIIFNISANGVTYENKEMIADIRNVLVLFFTPINGLISIPFMASILNKAKNNEIKQNEFKKKTIILGVVFLVILIMECKYLTGIQNGILNIVNKM